MFIADATGLVGLDDPAGRRLACEAYDTFAAGGVTALTETLSHCLLAPHEHSNSA